MSVRVMTWVWDHSSALLAERLVLLAIADMAHDDGHLARPSVVEIARKANIEEPAVHLAMRNLASGGLLRATVGPGGWESCAVVMCGQPDSPTRPQRARRQKMSPARRSRVFDRDGHQCTACGWTTEDPWPEGCRSMCLEIDHVIPLALGGTNDIANLQTLCSLCNRAKGVQVEWHASAR